MKRPNFISRIAIGSAGISLLSIFSLHFLSSEIDPTWHMVSEYAYGQYGWVLSLFFISWAISYWATGFALAPLSKSWIYRVGIFLVFISGLGAIMGGLFDVRHNLHGLAFLLGVPFVPIVAPFITRYLQHKYNLQNNYAILFSHATWASFILMAITMYLYISQMQKIGALSSTPQLLTSLPEGVTSVIGYANRLLVVSYLGWLIAINLLIIKLSKKVS